MWDFKDRKAVPVDAGEGFPNGLGDVPLRPGLVIHHFVNLRERILNAVKLGIRFGFGIPKRFGSKDGPLLDAGINFEVNADQVDVGVEGPGIGLVAVVNYPF